MADIPSILLVAVGDGQSRVCQETNRLFKFMRKRLSTDFKPNDQNIISTNDENKKVLDSLISDLVIEFWQTLLNQLFKKEQELQQKHIAFDSVYKELHNQLAEEDNDQIIQSVDLKLLKTLSQLWTEDPLIRRMFNQVDSDEYIQQLLNESVYSEFEYKTCESMIHYLMNDFAPRLIQHLESGEGLSSFVTNEKDFIFSSYKPPYRDIVINDNNKQILVTTINYETKESINVVSLLQSCSWLVFNFDLAIYSRNDLHEIVDMFCAKSRYENMTTHDSFVNAHNTDNPPVAVIRTGWNNMHMSLARYGLGMLPSEMFTETLNHLAAEKVRSPKIYRSPDVKFRAWEAIHPLAQSDYSGARFEELSEDEWSQVIKFVGNPDDMLALSQTNSTLRSLISRPSNDNFWKEAMIGKSTNYMRDKKTKAYENFVKDQQEIDAPTTWKAFTLYARQEIHKNLSKEICDFIMKKNALSYVTGEREKKIPDVEKVKFYDADGMDLESMKNVSQSLLQLIQ